TNFEEIKVKACINFVAIEPGKIVMPAGCPETKQKIEDAGVEVIEAQVDEILKGWGAIHCMTAFLKRDPVADSKEWEENCNEKNNWTYRHCIVVGHVSLQPGGRRRTRGCVDDRPSFGQREARCRDSSRLLPV